MFSPLCAGVCVRRLPTCVRSAQPSRVRWNVEKLGEAVRWAVPERIAKEALDAYDAEYERCLRRRAAGAAGGAATLLSCRTASHTLARASGWIARRPRTR